jgi:hypothetical protein
MLGGVGEEHPDARQAANDRAIASLGSMERRLIRKEKRADEVDRRRIRRVSTSQN